MLVAESMGRLFVHRPARARALRPLVPTLTRPAAQIRTTFAALRSLGRLTTRLPASPIQGGIGPHRRWSAAHADLADIKAIKRAFGGTVNDVVLAVIAGAFRDLLADLGEDPDHAVLRTLVPVSVRSDGDDAPNNQVAAMIAELPIGIADPLERLASIRDQMEHLKASGQADSTQTLTTLAGLTAPSVLALALRAATVIGRHVPQRAVGTVTTNVRGPDHTLYAAGRKMVAYQPFVPIAQGVRIGVAILSYDGNVSFGVTGDYDTVPTSPASADRSSRASTTCTNRPAARPGRGSDVVLWPRHRSRADDRDMTTTTTDRLGMTVLATNESLELLRSSVVGRLAVSITDHPDIFPINYVVDHGCIVFRTAEGTKLAAAVLGRGVAFEVDGYDQASGEAWSVVVKGHAVEIEQIHDLFDAVELPLFSWQAAPKPRFVRIEPVDISGRRFSVVEDARPSAPNDPATPGTAGARRRLDR